jgi:hypothetical protein
MNSTETTACVGGRRRWATCKTKKNQIPRRAELRGIVNVPTFLWETSIGYRKETGKDKARIRTRAWEGQGQGQGHEQGQGRQGQGHEQGQGGQGQERRHDKGTAKGKGKE